MIKLALLLITQVVLIRVYFIVASKYAIVDRPNERSSHSRPTIRGAGVIVPVSVVLWFLLYDFTHPLFLCGTILIAAISFADDIKSQPLLLRLAAHLFAFSLMLYDMNFVSPPAWMILGIVVIGIGILNAFNFMDGINGMTGVYSMVTLVSLYICNTMNEFVSPELIFSVGIAIAIFLYYNFRTQARCFAGDVGAVTIAFVLCYMLMQLFIKTENYNWIVFFTLYGVDSIVTIVYRLVNRENIFLAHRSHLYQYFANELKMSHLAISVAYGMLQLAINLFVLIVWPEPTFIQVLSLLIVVVIAYLTLREFILFRLGRKGLWINRFKLPTH
jgi:UDP-GlcNAc:undecaprenyl-phosphate/decaprenyl-phosphate GlcNAc-1-phosphate transferase